VAGDWRHCLNKVPRTQENRMRKAATRHPGRRRAARGKHGSRTKATAEIEMAGLGFNHVSGRCARSVLPKFYAIEAVAKALDVSARTVRRWIANRDLTVLRVHGVVRIADSDLRAFLARHREG
jgi:excisionase family DNA binding protein